MTDALRTKIQEAHKEEIADREKYRSLAEMAKKEGVGCAGILCDIADDEETHMRALEHMLSMEH